MAITFEGAETAANTFTGQTIVTVNKPAGATEDDVAIAAICADDDDAASLPSGFTVWDDRAQSGQDFRLVVGFKVLGASEPSSYDFTKHDNEVAVAAIAIFRGVKTPDPLDVAIVTDEGNSAFPTSPTTNTSTNDAAVISLFGAEKGSMSTVSAPSGMTEFYSISAGPATTDAISSAAWALQATAGSTGAKQWEVADDDTWIAHTIVLRDATASSVVLLDLAEETDSAFDVTAPVVGFADTSVETDESFDVTSFQAFAIGLSTEGDQGRSLSALRTTQIGLSSEDDDPLPLGSNVLVRITDETDESLQVIAGSIHDVGISDETDAGLSVSVGLTLQVGVGDELDAARGLAEAIFFTVGVAIDENESLPRELALTDWPPTLPQSLLLEGLSINLAGAGFRRDMESGPAYQRQIQTDQIIPVKGNIWVTKTQYDTLVQFWKGALAHGTRNFKWKHPITEVDAKMQMVADQPPVILARNGNDLLVQLEMEILPDPIFLPGLTLDLNDAREFDIAPEVSINLEGTVFLGIAEESDVSNVVAVG